jgi:hypothetical protein
MPDTSHLRARILALEPVLTLLSDALVRSRNLCVRWRLTSSHLANSRRVSRGPPVIRLALGGKRPPIRYRVSDIVAAELFGVSGAVSLDLALIAIAACADLPLDTRAALQEHLRSTLGAGRPASHQHAPTLPVSTSVSRHEAYSPVVDWLHDMLIKPAELVERWSSTESRLALLRRTNLGLPFVRLPFGKKGMGAIRYRFSEIEAAEQRGAMAHVTVAAIEVALTSFRGLTAVERARVLDQVRVVLGGLVAPRSRRSR